MRKNKLKKIFAEGKAVINGWLQIPNSFSSEVMANQGWDSLTIDMQHGVVDYPNALQMLQAISTTEVVPMARVNWNEPGQIMKILDAGSYGVYVQWSATENKQKILLRHVFIHQMVIEALDLQGVFCMEAMITGSLPMKRS